jgi:hypothetical protein
MRPYRRYRLGAKKLRNGCMCANIYAVSESHCSKACMRSRRFRS